MNWKSYRPTYDYHAVMYDYHLPWTGHIFFGYDLIRNIRPKVIVELGTYKGTSLFSFSQAVLDGKLRSKIYAIDCWEGEDHTGRYGSDILKNVRYISNNIYKKINISLVKKYFDDAVLSFKDNSIDLLHIDGMHTYEAVKNDYLKWSPKVKDDGVIMLHDIDVLSRGFGVHKLWKEIKEKQNTISFHHSEGLGLIIRNKSIFNKLKKIELKLQNKYRETYNFNKRLEVQKKHSLILYINELNLLLDRKNQDLEIIQSSKVYNAWQIYCNIRKKILRLL